MEHANIAFLMVAGMLFAIMIMSLIAYVFSSLTVLPNEEDSRKQAVQAAAFNEEYLAYDKKIMYGTDVISVLNKAKSNNDKYVLEKFIAGGGYNTDFIIDIQVTIKSALEESIEVTHVMQTATGVIETPYTTDNGPVKESGDNYYASEIFTAPKGNYQTIIYGSTKWTNTAGGLKFVTQTFDSNVSANTYHLLGTDGGSPVPEHYTNDELNADNTLKQLLSQSTVMLQTKKNRNGETFAPNGWSQATWKPAIYAFKARKFKCIGTETKFSEKTGRIIKMVFEEYDSSDLH